MKYFKTAQLFVLSFTMWSCAVAQTPENKTEPPNLKTNEKIEACEPTPALENAPVADIKTLAGGANSKIETPFVFVARDAKTYALLREQIENLPAASELDFSKNAVVAAFAGMKNTGGYSVEIKQTGETVSASVAAPPADAMVTQALTSPFSVALVPVEEEKSLNLSVSDDFKSAAKYRVAASDFRYSGGLLGREKKFSAEGAVNVMQAGDLVTLDFELSGKGENKEMKLTETASGVLKNGRIEILRLDAGSFSEGPKPPVKVSGSLTGDKLNLIFEPLPTNVADGFSMSGKLEAVKNR